MDHGGVLFVAEKGDGSVNFTVAECCCEGVSQNAAFLVRENVSNVEECIGGLVKTMSITTLFVNYGYVIKTSSAYDQQKDEESVYFNVSAKFGLF